MENAEIVNDWIYEIAEVAARMASGFRFGRPTTPEGRAVARAVEAAMPGLWAMTRPGQWPLFACSATDAALSITQGGGLVVSDPPVKQPVSADEAADMFGPSSVVRGVLDALERVQRGEG